MFKKIENILLGCICFFGTESFSKDLLHIKNRNPYLKSIPNTSQLLRSEIQAELSNSLFLNNTQSWNAIPQLLNKKLSSFGMGDGINIRRNNSTPSLSLTGIPLRSSNLKFFAGEHSICNFELKVHEVIGTSAFIMGSFPKTPNYFHFEKSDWPKISEVIPLTQEKLDEEFQNQNIKRVDIEESCLAMYQDQYVPAQKLHIRTERHAFSALVTRDEVILLAPAYFDATGMARVYEKNPSDPKLKDFTLNDLVGDGKLNNHYFQTYTNGVTQASSTSLQFIYDPSDKRFAETSAFAHGSEMYDWFISLGFSKPNTSAAKIILDLHSTDESLTNNAQYMPGSGSDLSTIQIGDGDGTILANLPNDSDVVAHELGHHIIFQTLTSTTGESIVLHEGIADFFAFAKSGDACLGESICPTSSRFCAVKGKCLRTAENSYKYGASDLPKEDHEKSQFISGMLWDLRKNQSIPSSDLSPLVFKALGYLLSSSGYYDFIASLMISDRNNFSGKYCEAILQAAKDRGLSPVLGSLDCSSDLSSLIGSQKQTNSGSTSQSKSESSSGGLCGTVQKSQNTVKTNLWMHMWILLLPLFVQLFTLRQKLKSS